MNELEEAIGAYWDCAYQEGHLRRPEGTKATAILDEIRSAVKFLVATEREACAKVCDALYDTTGPACDDHPTADDAARAIRARGLEQNRNSANGTGWLLAHPHYGKWFLTREAVVADWKQDYAQAYPNTVVPEPGAGAVETWFQEQISWIDVAAYGTQLERPDMAAIEAGFRRQMTGDSDYVALG